MSHMVAERGSREHISEHGADSVYKSHSGSIVETSEDLKAKAESQMAEARRTEVRASRNFQMRQQFLEDELKFNAQDLEATENSLDEAQGPVDHRHRGLEDDGGRSRGRHSGT